MLDNTAPKATTAIDPAATEKNQLNVTLQKPAGTPSAYECLRVMGSEGNALDISFRRTIRVPDNDKTYRLPPDCGPFPIYAVRGPTTKRGVCIPMYRKYHGPVISGPFG